MLSERDFRQLLRKYPEIRVQLASLAAQREEIDRQLLAEGPPPEAPRPFMNPAARQCDEI